MTQKQEEILLREIGEIHGVLFRNGWLKRSADMETKLNEHIERPRCSKSADIERIERDIEEIKRRLPAAMWKFAQLIVSLSGWAAVLVVVLKK